MTDGPTEQDRQLAATLRDLADEVERGSISGLVAVWADDRREEFHYVVGLHSERPDIRQGLASELENWTDELRTMNPEASCD